MAGQGGGLALIPWLLAFWGLGTVENVMRTEKFTVPFGNIGVRHGIVTPRIKEVTNPFIKRIFVRCSIRHP